jgi:hypothetical protein
MRAPLSVSARACFDAHRVLMAGIGLQLALLMPALIALFLDERTVRDVATWAKPIKFQLSLALAMANVALILPLMSQAWRASRTLRMAVLAMVTASTFDILYFTLQAARGRASHFNRETPLESMLYEATGVAALVIVAAWFIAGLALLRSASVASWAGTRWGAALGLMTSACLTLVVAGVMAAEMITETGRWVDGVRSDATGLPLVGWSTTGGDLRVSHFVATHLMQALLLAGFLADRISPLRARSVVGLSAVAGAGLVVATFLQALVGRPFLRL